MPKITCNVTLYVIQYDNMLILLTFYVTNSVTFVTIFVMPNTIAASRRAPLVSC